MPLGTMLLLLGKVPLLNIDKTVKISIYLLHGYLAITFFSASKSGINEAQLEDRIQGLAGLKARDMAEAAFGLSRGPC